MSVQLQLYMPTGTELGSVFNTFIANNFQRQLNGLETQIMSRQKTYLAEQS